MGRASRGKEERRLERAEAPGVAPEESEVSFISRRQLLTGMAAIAAVYASTVGAVLLSKDDEVEEQVSDPERMTDAVIAKAEEGFIKFKARAVPLIMAATANYPEIRGKLMASFEVMDINRQNPDRNFPRLQAKMRAQGVTEYKQPNSSPYIFSYIARKEENIAAGYVPISKTMALSPDFDPESLHDLLVLYHELKHVVHDTNERRTFKSSAEFEAYINFYSSPNVILNDEMEAYAFEIELLNLMVNGELEKAAQEGRSVNLSVLQGVAKDQEDILKLAPIINLSQLFYPNGLRGMYYDENSKFVRAVAEASRKINCTIWHKKGTGELVKY